MGRLGPLVVLPLRPPRHGGPAHRLGPAAHLGTYPIAAQAADTEWYHFTVYSWLGAESLGEVQLIFGATLACFALVVLGLGSRVVVPLAWLLLLSMINRNGVWTDSSDAMMRVFGFYLILMPTGRAWSVDVWLRKRLGWRPQPPPAHWSLRLFQLQLCILYVKTGIVNAMDSRWQDGVAIFHTLSEAAAWRFPMEEFLAREWFQTCTIGATWATLVFQAAFFLAFIPRLRRWWLLGGLCLHVGLFVFVEAGGLTMVVLWTYLAFLLFPERPR